MKKFMAALSTCILIYSLCACSTGAGSISTPTSEESPSPSSTALPESSEGPSSRGIAPDYKNSPYFLPVGSMEFTVIDNTAVPEFEGKEFALGVGHDFTSLEDKVLAQKEKMIKKNQVISGLIVSPDGKSNAYYLITYKIDKTTGETLEIIDDSITPCIADNLQLIVEFDGQTKELYHRINCDVTSYITNELVWLDNEKVSCTFGNFGDMYFDIYNVKSNEKVSINTPETIEKFYNNENYYSNYMGVFNSAKNMVVFIYEVQVKGTENEWNRHNYFLFYDLNKKQWLENYIFFTEFAYWDFRVTWSEQTNNLLLFLQKEKIDGNTFYIWEYNPITNQKVEIKALKCNGESMAVVDIRDDLIIWGQAKPMGAPAKVFLYDYIDDQWLCYMYGLYEGIVQKNKNMLSMYVEIMEDSEYLGYDIFAYDINSKTKYYVSASRRVEKE